MKDKYKRPKPEQSPIRKKGNSDIINKIVQQDLETINTTEKKVKKATFQLDADLHKKLRTFAAVNDTTMLDIVEKAIIEYLDKANK